MVFYASYMVRAMRHKTEEAQQCVGGWGHGEAEDGRHGIPRAAGYLAERVQDLGRGALPCTSHSPGLPGRMASSGQVTSRQVGWALAIQNQRRNTARGVETLEH